MIIHRVAAENVLKYGRLILEDLPEQGVIAVSGRNEAGTSSIGETSPTARRPNTVFAAQHSVVPTSST